MHFQQGQEIVPGFRLEKFLGKGQFGEVWSAVGPGRTKMALKIIDLRGKLGWKEFRGIQRVKAIRHAHLMPITALWLVDHQGTVVSDDTLDSVPLKSEVAPPANATLVVESPQLNAKERQVQWLVVAMLLADKSLLERLHECQRQGLKGIPLEECLTYMEEAAKGIDFLNTPQHDLGEGPVAIQHCDIKPDNIMLVGGSVLVCDYGVARVLAADSNKPTATAIAGSPAYMAPECIAGKQPSRATDQYSLAITYYQLRTGEFPAQGETYLQVLESHAKGQLDFSLLSPAEQKILRRATALLPKDRYRSASEFVQHLRAAAGLGGKQTRGAASRASTRWLLILTILVLAAVVGWGAGWTPSWWPFSQKTNPLIRNGEGQDASDENGSFGNQGGTNPVIVFEFEPSEVEVRINGVVQQLDPDGTLRYQFSSDEIALEVRPRSEDYLLHVESLMSRDVEGGRKRVELQRSATYWIGQARTALGNGNQELARAHWAKAASIDARWFKPSPHAIKAGDNGIDRVHFLARNDRLVSIDKHGAILLVTFDARRQVTFIRVGSHRPYVENIALSADGRWLATAGCQKMVYLWDLSSAHADAPAAIVDHSQEVIAVAMAPDHSWLAVGDNDAGVAFWRLDTQAPAGQWLTSMAGEIQKIHADQLRQLTALDSRRVVSLCEKGELVMWTFTADRQRVEHRKLEPPMAGSGRRPTLREIIVIGESEFLTRAEFPHVIDRWSAIDATHVKRIGETDEIINSLAVASDSGTVVAGTETGDVWLFDVQSDRPPERMRFHTNAVVGLAISPDERWLITGAWDGSVALWDLSQNAEQRWPLMLGRHELQSDRGNSVAKRVNMVAVSPDGRWLASAGDDGHILLWDLAECELIRHVIGSEGKRIGPTIDTRSPLPIESGTPWQIAGLSSNLRGPPAFGRVAIRHLPTITRGYGE